MSQVEVPRCMSTQHPDNVNPAFFSENAELGGEDEIQEAYYVFSHLGCEEQMWDCEGKEVDDYVVKKILTKYESFFRKKRLGEDVFLTLRVPNPSVEKAEAKVLLETLESIPRSFDAANLFYEDHKVPIFEVILPMTSSSESMDRVYRYYKDFVAGKQDKNFKEDGITISEWIGEFKPEKINVIPLFEDMENMLNAHNHTREYLKDKDLDYQRVFLARSDPAMNYGLITAVLLNKIALQRLERLEEETGVDIYPIVGAGSAPFRGNLRPENVERVMEEYPSSHTFTIQSSFKYDNSPDEIRKAITKIQESETGPAHKVEEEKCLEIIRKYAQEYKRQIVDLAPVVNKVSQYIPSRRKRKLHIGLFGYSRDIEGIKLPRAISFTAALYSIGLPPEILGLNALSEDELQFVKEIYVHFEEDIEDALKFFNPDTEYLPSELEEKVKEFSLVERNERYKRVTDRILNSLQGENNRDLQEDVLRAANIRGFLG